MKVIIAWVLSMLMVPIIGFGQELTNKLDSVSYAVGTMVVRTLKQQGIEDLNYDLVVRALQEGLAGEATLLTEAEAGACIKDYVEALKEQVYEENRQEGETFLTKNAEKDSVRVLPSGLQYEVLVRGTGKVSPGPTDNVTTHYHGTLINGEVFDSSVERGNPLSFPVNGVIKGWQEALQLMKVGDKWRLYIPYDLAYGDRSAGPKIKPYSALIFEVELIAIGSE